MAGEKSQIQRFYEDKAVLVTGGTGFMGKILIEKLLRSTEVETIYIVIRTKKGKNMHTRLDELFDDLIFNRLKKEKPKYKHRVVGIAGDCSITGLGLTITDRQKLIENVEIVFHVAATVRFDENIKLAYSINVKGTGDVIELCRQMKNLKAAMHVSTAYSNCHLSEIAERLYDHPLDYEKVGSLLEKMSRSETEKLTPRILGQWPNTYTFTKALAETMIKNVGGGLPIGVFRPAIVVSTYREPIPGWIDNLYGPNGVCAGGATGVLRVLHCDRNVVADIVPVDTCVAALMAAAWDVAERKNERISRAVPVYNYVSSAENPITWQEYNTLNIYQVSENPPKKSIWCIRFHTVANRKMYSFLKVLYHFLPALLLDLATIVSGRKPRVISMYKKIHKFSDVISFFSTRQWKFDNDNVQRLWRKMNEKDKELFPLSMMTVPWLTYFRMYFKGIRVYLLRDPLDTLEEGRIRQRRLEIAHKILMAALQLGSLLLCWFFLSKMASMLTPSTVTTTYKAILRNSTYCDHVLMSN